MGLMGRILGAGGAAASVGSAVTGVAEVFVGNRAEREAAEHAQRVAAIAQLGTEFARPPASRFDGFMNGLNRLPRPLLVTGTLGLFVYAMAAPAGFSVRMQGLALAPEPLWWLLGAIVSFYFGARELHYFREAAPQTRSLAVVAAQSGAQERPEAEAAIAVAEASPGLGAAAFAPAEGIAPTPFFGALAPRPAPCAAPRPEVAVRAEDPQFNAALEEWRRIRA